MNKENVKNCKKLIKNRVNIIEDKKMRDISKKYLKHVSDEDNWCSGKKNEIITFFGNQGIGLFKFYKDHCVFIKCANYSKILECEEIFSCNNGALINNTLIEYRDNGIVVAWTMKNFRSLNFEFPYCITDLVSERCVLKKELLNDDINYLFPYCLDYSKYDDLMNQVFMVRDICKNNEDKISLINKFSAFLLNCGGNYFIPQFCLNLNNIHLNSNNVSSYYSKISGGDQISRIFDLYNGVINKNNFDDLFNLDPRMLDGFDLITRSGIRKSEDDLVGGLVINSKLYYKQLSE